MEIRQISYFLSIVEKGSFSAAADDHFISQSALSKKIIELEKEIGVSLFDRSKRKVSLTSAGEAFLDYAHKFKALNQNMIVELKSYKSNTDTFDIAVIPIIPEYGIASYFAEFSNAYPNISFDLEERDGLNILSSLDEGRFDLAITRNNFINEDKHATVEICKDKLIVMVSKKNRYANRTSISLHELSKDNFIVFDNVTDLRKLIIEVCQKAGFTPTIFYSSHRKVSVFSLVGANIGLALMPSKVCEYHNHPDILAIPLDEIIDCNIVLVWQKNKKLPKSAEIFIDFLQHNLIEQQNN